MNTRNRKYRNRKYKRKSRKIKGGMMDDLDWSLPRQTSDISLSSQNSDIEELYSQGLSRQPSQTLPRQTSDISISSLDSDDIELLQGLSRQPSPPLYQPNPLYGLVRQPSVELTFPEMYRPMSRQDSDEIGDILSQFRASTNAFTDLCNRHIMGQNLDEVIEKSWLQNGPSNIFLIGEHHQPHTKCIGILDMFKRLVADVKRHNMVDVDLLIEHTQYDTLPEVIAQHTALTSESYQINYVRDHFNTCIINRNCDIRVHWTDPSMSKKIEEWMLLLAKEDPGYIEWVKKTSIYDSFNSEDDIPRLVTDNVILMKEIRKASRYVPQFTIEWVLGLFMEQYIKYSINQEFSWKKIVTIQLRHVMDFYTVARILSFQMKNVIVYGGFVHMTYIKYLLKQLNYITVDTVNGQCFT